MVSAAPPLHRERRALLATLLVLAAAGWGVVIWQSVVMTNDMDTMGIDLTMGMAAPLFLVMWVAMMVAMMFPASAPMILAFARTQERKRERGAPAVPTWLFIAPYVAVWAAFGVVGYAIAVAADAWGDDSMWAMHNLPRIAGGGMLLAGLYELTPLKQVCLSRCRTPLSFMLSYWRDGRRGALSMGLRHGLFCLGCCWALFLVLLPIGVMNIGAMLIVTALVFAEKALPGGEAVATGAALALVMYGTLVMAVPATLPTMVT